MKSNMIWNLNWASASDFLAMGGYGLYVWGSFGVTALVMLLEMWSLSMRRKSLLASHGDQDETNLENS
jgi:heme exporter protein D